MTKQQLSVQSPRHVPPATKRPAPVPGERLRRAVDVVLAGLDSGGADLARLDDVLRAALAWTAAAGDTCRVASSVHLVREARTRLAHGDTEHARSSLDAARDGLHVVPKQRMH